MECKVTRTSNRGRSKKELKRSGVNQTKYFDGAFSLEIYDDWREGL